MRGNILAEENRQARINDVIDVKMVCFTQNLDKCSLKLQRTRLREL